MAKEKKIEVPAINPEIRTITIVGTSDLVLNKMNDQTVRTLTDQRKDKAKSLDKPNEWEEVVTAIHWLNGKPDIDPSEYSAETMEKMLKENKPCISAFGLKKQLCKAVVRNKIETYSTGFDANVNIIPKGDGLIPIDFAEHYIDEKLMSPKRGAPVLARLNRFSGWSADVEVAYMDNAYSIDSIVSIFNLAGFGLGIGSGTSSGFGRFKVEGVK